jgi:hypothetical protein
MPSHRRAVSCARPRLLTVAFPIALVLGAAVPATAAAAPQAAINCGGSLARATPTVDDTNLLNYTFYCTGDISAYTLTVNRQVNDFETLDDFSTTATVFDPTKTTVVATQSTTCEGLLPGNGVNCYAAAGTPAVVSAYNHVQGTIDTTDPYCSNIPTGSPAGTLPEPQAMVQLVVSDTSGSQDGPFRLDLLPRCPPPPKPKPKKVKIKVCNAITVAGKKHKKCTTITITK